MIGLRQIVVWSTFALATLASSHGQADSRVDWDQLSALIDTIDRSALHRVLHAFAPNFQDGIFSKDRSAVEHVHSKDPVMATKLVHMAKRQTTNSTTSVSPSISSALSSAITATTVPSPTTLLVSPTAPSSAVAVSTRSDGAVVYSTSGGGLVTLTSSGLAVSFTPSTSVHLFTTTGADGQLGTSTSVVVVNAPITATGGSQNPAQSSGVPGLQNAAVPAAMAPGWAAVIAVLGWLAAL